MGRRSRCWEDDLVEALVAEKLLCWMGKETMAWVGWAMSCRRSPSRFATRVGQEILHFAVTWDDTGEIQVKTRGLNRIELLSCERRSHRKVGNIARTNRKDSKYAGSLIRRFVECSSHKGSPVIGLKVHRIEPYGYLYFQALGSLDEEKKSVERRIRRNILFCTEG